VQEPETSYARTPEGAVAYQVIGNGPLDVVFVPDWVSNIEIMWEEPRIERFLHRLASFSRLIVFDKRGCGLSDPVPLGALPTLEQWMDDIRAVMDAARSERAAIFGWGWGGIMTFPFAATHPDRTAALVVGDTYVRSLRAPDFAPGLPTSAAEKAMRLADSFPPHEYFALLEPRLTGDTAFMTWAARYFRHSLSPMSFERMWRWAYQLDVRNVLPSIRVPTLVLHRSGDRLIRPAQGRYIADHIAGATYVELSGDNHLWFLGDQDGLIDEIQAFLTGARGMPEIDRVLATVVFTDLVESTERAAQLGDRQ
jgi:pimeloyl-ACP methyl ester carboxylesterase